MKRNILTIFLASPGDLQEEREIVRDTVNRVNKILSRKVGWHIELLGWEDTLPGYSRPQSLINKDVDSCQLFLGILWRRWGQDTGEYSSGFEEEFIRARERKRNTDSPEIWLYFKAIDEDSAKDPGEQLKKVLNFKQEQIENKKLMFKEFPDLESWRDIIYDALMTYVLDLSIKESEMLRGEEILSVGRARELHTDKEAKAEETEESYPSDLINLFSKIDSNLKEGKPSELDMSELTRLYLQSSAWFSVGHLGEVFGNHEINLAYIQRRDWKLSYSERWFLVRSFICDKHDNRPGWYWIKIANEDKINDMIIWIATKDTSIDVRRAAFSLLADIEFKATRDLLETGLSDDDNQVVLNAIRLFRNTKDIENLDLIEKVLENDDSNVRDKAVSAKIENMYLANPNEAFSYLIDSGAKIPPLIKNTIQDLSLEVDNDLLLKALEKADSSVRRFSAQYLLKSNLLKKEKCYELLKDTDARVRKEGLQKLIELGEEVDMDFVNKLFSKPKGPKKGLFASFREVRARDFVPILLKKSDPNELLSQLDFYDLNDDEAYRLLAVDHFDLIELRIRNDLDQGFENLKKESEKRLVGRLSKDYKTDTIEFMRDTFISAALDGLAINGKQEDVKYARKYLGNTKYNVGDKGAIGLLSKYGDSSDVENLIKAAKRNYGQTAKSALEAAYKFSNDKDTLLERLVNSDDDTIAEIAVRILSSYDSPRRIEIAKNLLNSETAKRRVEALAILFRLYDTQELEKLLDDYISQQSYYYNVATWLDRCLYSKGRYLNYFKSKVSKMIE